MGIRSSLFALMCCMALLHPGLTRAGSFLVSTEAELEEAVSNARPGDSIILKDQVWAGIDIYLTCKGTEERPITICPESPGGASLEAGSRIEIGGEYLVVSGFRIVNGSSLNSAVVFISNGIRARHCRLTDCLIDGWGPSDPATKVHWVVLTGAYNRIDHCRFSNMNHRGVTLMIKAGADETGHHLIDHNYFGTKPEGDGNAYETIKLGGGDYSMYPLYTTVERNYFYRCDGEVELISNKSWSNTFRSNTFFECQGTLTLRWGRQCLVEGNYFLGNGRSATGGIRITDQDHLIVNNYLSNIRGDDARAAISVMSGIPDAEGGNSGHGQTKNARILHNTIVNCEESLNMGYYDEDDLDDPRGDILPPENCTLANNIIWSHHKPLIKEDWAPSINTTWLANIAYGADLGLIPDSGMTVVDPLLERSAAGIYKLTEESPAINAGAFTSDTLVYDFEKQKRMDGLPDIGADEVSEELVEKLPTGPEDVGPGWYNPASLTNSYAASAAPEVFPNPVNQRFFIRLNEQLWGSDLHVEVVDMSGRVIHSEELLNVQANPEIVVPAFHGMHLVRVRSSGRFYHIPVIFKQ